MSPPPDHKVRDLAVLTADLRNATAAVIGYLDLILEGETISDAQLRWLGIVERRLEALERLSSELRALCAELHEPRHSSPGDPDTVTEPTAK